MINTNKKIIFYHTPKTGGTSIRSVLKEQMGFTNIFRVIKQDELKAAKEYIEENYVTFPDYVDWAIRQPQYADYMKFTFVRNPYDRVVSAWYQFADTKKIKLYDFVNILVERNMWKYDESIFKMTKKNVSLRQHVICKHLIPYTDTGYLDYMDFIGRFENLQKDFDTACDRFGLDTQKLPKLGRKPHKKYNNYYNEKTKKLVSSIYEKDINEFGYKYEEKK